MTYIPTDLEQIKLAYNTAWIAATVGTLALCVVVAIAHWHARKKAEIGVKAFNIMSFAFGTMLIGLICTGASIQAITDIKAAGNRVALQKVHSTEMKPDR